MSQKLDSHPRSRQVLYLVYPGTCTSCIICLLIFLVSWVWKIMWKQAGLSRATLKISSNFPSNFPLRTQKSQSNPVVVLTFWCRFPIFSFLRIWFGHLSLSSKFEYNTIRSCWDIPLLIFWGPLPWVVLFILSICRICFGRPRLSLKFEYDKKNSCQDISLFYILGLSSIGDHFHLKDLQNMVWSYKLKFEIWVR